MRGKLARPVRGGVARKRPPQGTPRRAAYSTPKLFAQLKALPWAKVPVGVQTRETGHGRKETRTVKALTVKTPGGLGFPRAEQAVRITRTRTIKGKTTREAAYLTISLPAGQAQPTDLGTWARSEWHIEIVYITCGMSRYVRTPIKPGQAAGLPYSPRCVTPQLDTTTSTAPPTSPKPPDEPTIAHTTSSTP